MRFVIIAVMLALGSSACGASPFGGKGMTQLQETEGRHCTDNSECPDGACHAGRCG